MAIRDNWERSFPATQMGTAELGFYVVDMGYDVESDASLSDSVYSRAIRGLQNKVDLYLIGQPNGQYFTIAARESTVVDAQPGAITGTSASLGHAIAEACGDEVVLSVSINNSGTNVDVGDEFEFSHADLAQPVRVRVTASNMGHATQVQLLNAGEWTNRDVLPPSNSSTFTRTQVAAGQDYNATGLQINMTWGLGGVNVYYASLIGGSLVWND